MSTNPQVINPNTMMPSSLSPSTDTTTSTGTENPFGLPTSLNDEVEFLNNAGGDNVASPAGTSPSLVNTGEAPLGLTPPIDPYTQAVVSGTLPQSAAYPAPQSGFSFSLSNPYVKYGILVLVVGLMLVTLYIKRNIIFELLKDVDEEIKRDD